MDLFIKLFGELLGFIYHCFVVIHGYLTGLSRHVAHFFREVVGVPVITKETLRQRTNDYQSWVEAFARNHRIPIQWPDKGIRREDYVLRWLRRIERKNAYGVYFIFKSMEVGPTFRITVPKYSPTTPITASSPTSAAGSPITISTFAMKCLAPSGCAWAHSFPSRRPTTSTATASSSTSS